MLIYQTYEYCYAKSLNARILRFLFNMNSALLCYDLDFLHHPGSFGPKFYTNRPILGNKRSAK